VLPSVVVVVVALALAYVVTRDRVGVLGAVALPLVLVGLSFVLYKSLRHVLVVTLSAVVGFVLPWLARGSRVAWG
jgi:hypothetical protein